MAGEQVLDLVMAGHVIGLGILRRSQRPVVEGESVGLQDLEADVRLTVLINAVLAHLHRPAGDDGQLDLRIAELLEESHPDPLAGLLLAVAVAANDCRDVLHQAAELRRRGRLVESQAVSGHAAIHLLEALDDALSLCTAGQAQVVYDATGAIDLGPREGSQRAWEVSP